MLRRDVSRRVALVRNRALRLPEDLAEIVLCIQTWRFCVTENRLLSVLGHGGSVVDIVPVGAHESGRRKHTTSIIDEGCKGRGCLIQLSRVSASLRCHIRGSLRFGLGRYLLLLVENRGLLEIQLLALSRVVAAQIF